MSNVASLAARTLVQFNQDYDYREEFREAVIMTLQELREEKKFIQAARVRRFLRSEKKLEQAYNMATSESAVLFAQDEKLANGDFAKWFLEWLENGGWELIVKIIKEVIGLMG